MHGSRSPEHDGQQPVILNLECSPGVSPAAIAMRWHVPRIGNGVPADEAADCARTPAYPTSGPPRACREALNGAAATPAARPVRAGTRSPPGSARSEEHTSELQSLMRISYAVFCLKKKKK